MPILDWLDKEAAVTAARRAPYRLLEEVPELGVGEEFHENLLVQGDNLDALKALLPLYAGQVKCIYIDPPYNTRSAFEHYDDNLEHSRWLSMIYPRLELLRELLSEEGSLWVSIDDHESHYLKLLLDELFGRRNFLANVVWQKKYAPANDAVWLSDSHDHILVYAKDKGRWRPNKLPRSAKSDAAYKNPDDDPRGPWKAGDYTCAKSADERPNLYYPITNPTTGQEVWPGKTRVWAYSQELHATHVREGRIWWGRNGTNQVPAFKRFLAEMEEGTVPQTLWSWEEVGHTQDGRKEQIGLMAADPFDTSKPEKLIQRILQIGSNPGDLVLDSFLGSGTTAAVAHKLGRRYIGIEMGPHAESHCATRLSRVIAGEPGGISRAVEWQGGGGFRFYRLGRPVFDEQGRINPEIDFDTLAAYLWFTETGTPFKRPRQRSPFLGVQGETAYYLLYDGILGDGRPDGGNVLTRKVLVSLPACHGRKVIFGEATRLGENALSAADVEFRQIPYDVKMR